MLLKFRLSNFLSFDEEQSITMVAGSSDSHPDHKVKSVGIDVLRASIIYGANASGKSNLVKAFLYSRNVVTGESIDEEFKGHISGCLSFETSQDKPSSFEYTFTFGGKLYVYGLEVQTPSGYVLNEWAYEIGSDGNKEIFNTEEMKQDEYKDPAVSGLYRKYLSVTDGNKLFLRYLAVAADAPDYVRSAVNAIYSWFRYSLIVRTNDSVDRGSVVSDDFKERFETSLKDLDTGITGLGTRKSLKNPKVGRCASVSRDFKVHCVITSDGELSHTFPCEDGSSAATISFKHGQFRNSYGGESRGTQRLIELLILLNSVNVLGKTSKSDEDMIFDKDLTLIADEIECGLHANLSKELLKRFFQDGSNNMQFIFTTHEARLLEPELVRSDEIWFVDNDYADQKKSSKLTSLAQFKLDPECRYRSAYLMGRFGAVPVVIRGDGNVD